MLFDRATIPAYSHDEFYEILDEKIHDPFFKGALHIHSRLLKVHAHDSRGEIIKRILKEPFITEFCGMEMLRNHKLFDAFDLKTQQLFVSGIIDYHAAFDREHSKLNYYKPPKLFTKEYLENTYPKSFPEEGPNVLTLEHLEAGFVIWITCLCLTLTVLLCEWLFILKEFILLRHIFGSFYHMRKSQLKYQTLFKVPEAEDDNPTNNFGEAKLIIESFEYFDCEV